MEVQHHQDLQRSQRRVCVVNSLLLSKTDPTTSNEFPIPDIPNEPCLLLCPHVTFLSLAFLRDAFDVPGLTPSQVYGSKVLACKGQQLFPWKREIEDAYIFRKSVRSAFGVDMADDHLPYEALNTRLKKVGELTGFSIPVGAYCFRRGNGEALDNSSESY